MRYVSFLFGLRLWVMGFYGFFLSFFCFVPDVAAVAWLLHNAGRKVTSGLVMQAFGSFFFLSFTIIPGGGFAICRSAPCDDLGPFFFFRCRFLVQM